MALIPFGPSWFLAAAHQGMALLRLVGGQLKDFLSGIGPFALPFIPIVLGLRLSTSGSGTTPTNPFVASSMVISNPGVFTTGQMNEYATVQIGPSASALTEFQRVQGGTRYATDALNTILSVPSSA